MEQIERAVCAALATYSNVHRGSGHHALVSTRLYEQARDIVLEHLGLSRKKYVVIFCTPRRATMLQARPVAIAASQARTSDCRWLCGPWLFFARHCPKGSLEKPVEARLAWSLRAGSSGRVVPIDSRPARPPSPTSSPSPGRCNSSMAVSVRFRRPLPRSRPPTNTTIWTDLLDENC